jgi:hypothetical protein
MKVSFLSLKKKEGPAVEILFTVCLFDHSLIVSLQKLAIPFKWEEQIRHKVYFSSILYA